MKLIEKIERKIVQKLLWKYPQYRQVVEARVVERKPLKTKKFSAEYRYFTSERTQAQNESYRKEDMADMIGRQIVRAGAYTKYEIDPQPDEIVKRVRMVVQVVIPEARADS